MTPIQFKDSQEAAFRRMVRDAVRKGPFTLGQKEITLALVNLWFHHRNGPDGFIHPGREKLARKTKLSIRLVADTLAMLRAAGVLHVVSHGKGGWGTSTRYKMNLVALLTLCGCNWVDQFLAGNCTHSAIIFAHTLQAKTAHGNKGTLDKTFSKGGDHA